jgi:hypothetical protein
MSDTRTDQQDNTVLGDQAGRDINKNYYTQSNAKTSMSSLIEQYKKEAAENQSLKDFIGVLQHYLNNVDGARIIGLEAKLNAGGRQSEIDEAISLKELFYKKLKTSQFSEAAQHMMAFILGDMREAYRAYVYPLIEKKEDKSAVDKIILEKILNPLLEKLEENVLRISIAELRGMLFFLTGNCHIRWD